MDARTSGEKFLWEKLGPPLYYCVDCMRSVKVTAIEGQEPKIERKCDHTGQIIAPRKAIACGEGGINMVDKAKRGVSQLAAALTGRCV
jgi:hypothetical protein